MWYTGMVILFSYSVSMKEPLYRDALRFGWQFAWKNKFLWVYGLFAAMLGQFGIFELLARVSAAVTNASGGVQLYWFRLPRHMMRGFWQMGWEAKGPDVIWIVWLILVGLGILVALIVVAVVSQGALIYAAAQGKTGRVAEDSREWHAGVDHFWRLFFLNAARKAAILFLVTMVGWASYSALISPTPSALLLFLALFILAALVGIVVSFFTLYVACYVVIEEYSFLDALYSAWRLFRRHWLVSLEVGLLFMLFNLLLAGLGVLGFFVLIMPAAVLWFLAFFVGNALLFGVAMLFLFVCFIAYVMFLGSVFTVFSLSVWTHLFMHMHRYGVKSRLMHWLHG